MLDIRLWHLNVSSLLVSLSVLLIIVVVVVGYSYYLLVLSIFIHYVYK